MNKLYNFLLTQWWFTLIVTCEVLKWYAASKLVHLIPWIKR